MVPVSERLTEANNKIINVKGSISAIENELAQVDEKKASAKEERKARIERLQENIKKCREEIQATEEKKIKGDKRLSLLQGLQRQVVTLEESDLALLEAYSMIKAMCQEYELGTIEAYDELSERYKADLAAYQKDVESIKTDIKASENFVKERQKLHEQKSKLYQKHLDEQSELTKKDEVRIKKINDEIAKIDGQLDKIEEQAKEYKKRQAELETLIARNSALMDGVIICPKCQHKFFAGNDVSVDDIRKNLISYRTEMEDKKSKLKKLDEEFDLIDEKAVVKSEEVDSINKQIKSRTKELDAEYSDLTALSREVDNAERKLSSLQKSLTSTENELERLNGKIEVLRNRLFGEITGILEGRIMNGENYISQQLSSIEFSKGQLAQYQKQKREIAEAPETDFAASLQSSLKKYQQELKDAEKEASGVQAEYDVLKKQELDFVMFKSYIARKKIDALSLVVNDFLGKIGSDIRLKLEGFTVTKTGKLRDKISVQVMRDGIDCGSYHKFSGGEKARLNLACILSLHTLTNSNCEDGKGLDFLIIDELLDKSDEVGLATYCEALNKLGQTSLLITQGGVSEGYPHKLLIVKKQGISTISN